MVTKRHKSKIGIAAGLAIVTSAIFSDSLAEKIDTQGRVDSTEVVEEIVPYSGWTAHDEFLRRGVTPDSLPPALTAVADGQIPSLYDKAHEDNLKVVNGKLFPGKDGIPLDNWGLEDHLLLRRKPVDEFGIRLVNPLAKPDTVHLIVDVPQETVPVKQPPVTPQHVTLKPMKVKSFAPYIGFGGYPLEDDIASTGSAGGLAGVMIGNKYYAQLTIAGKGGDSHYDFSDVTHTNYLDEVVLKHTTFSLGFMGFDAQEGSSLGGFLGAAIKFRSSDQTQLRWPRGGNREDAQMIERGSSSHVLYGIETGTVFGIGHRSAVKTGFRYTQSGSAESWDVIGELLAFPTTFEGRQSQSSTQPEASDVRPRSRSKRNQLIIGYGLNGPFKGGEYSGENMELNAQVNHGNYYAGVGFVNNGAIDSAREFDRNTERFSTHTGRLDEVVASAGLMGFDENGLGGKVGAVVKHQSINTQQISWNIDGDRTVAPYENDGRLQFGAELGVLFKIGRLGGEFDYRLTPVGISSGKKHAHGASDFAVRMNFYY